MIWIPLLESVAADHAHFPAVLISHIITRLLSDEEAEPDPDDTNATTTAVATTAAEKASYDVCIANWATWLIEWRSSSSAEDKSDLDITVRRQSVFFQLAQALVVTSNDDKHEKEQETSPKSQTGYVALPLRRAKTTKRPTN